MKERPISVEEKRALDEVLTAAKLELTADFNSGKIHDLPKPNYRKVIYLVRDGRDVMVSYFR